MQFKLNDKVKYIFPNPGNRSKEFIKGVISFIGEAKIVLICEDNSKLNVSFKNFDNIAPLDIDEEVTLG